MKASVFNATSLDGFIAREDGGIDWLPAENAGEAAGENYGYDHFIGSVHARWSWGATPTSLS